MEYERLCHRAVNNNCTVWGALDEIIELNGWSSTDLEKISGTPHQARSRIRDYEWEQIEHESLTVFCVALGLDYSVSLELFTKAGLHLNDDNPYHEAYKQALKDCNKYFFNIKEYENEIHKTAKEYITELVIFFGVVNPNPYVERRH